VSGGVTAAFFKMEFTMLKRFIIIAVLIGLLASCHDSSNNPNGKPVDPNNPNKSTFILFDNTQGICTVSVYDDYRRRDDDKIAEIPSGKNSAKIDWTPGDSVPFYFSYAVTFKDISGFTLNYVPEIGKDQKTVRIDTDTTTTIKVPTLSETFSSSDTLLSNNSYLFIQNNSSFSFELHQGTSKLKPDNISSFLVNNGEKAQYTINPGSASNYRLLVGADYKEFSGSIDNFEAGHIYNFDFNGSISLISDTELKLENVNGFAIPQSPAAPVVITSNGSITLQWTAVESATAYEIWMGTVNDSASSSKYGADVTASLSTTISGLNNGTTYYFWLKAKNNLGTSGFSPVASGKPSAATVKPPDPQTAPSIITGNGQLTVSWQAVVDTDVYEVWTGTTNNTTSAKKQGEDVSSFSTVITGLNNGTTYYVWIKAKNHIGVSGFSPVAIGTPSASFSVNPPDNLSQGLYLGEEKIGNQNLASSLSWISTNAVSGDIFYIVLGFDESITPNNSLSYNGKNNIIIYLTGIDSNRIINLSSQGSMFLIESGVSLILDNNITLRGLNNNDRAVVRIDKGGELIMNIGSTITNNNNSASNSYAPGGGINVNGGIFIMNGGTISNNTSLNGGGVNLNKGIFIMNGGIISNNTSSSSTTSGTTRAYGGGLYVVDGSFIINDGIISGNKTSISSSCNYSYGGGIYIENSIFIMNDGIISNNSSISTSSSSINTITESSGGGVYVTGCDFTIKGGSITENITSATSTYNVIAKSYGGGIYITDGNLILSGGTISGNNSSSSNSTSNSGHSRGGGVCATNFTMSGGNISGNTVNSSYSYTYNGYVYTNGGGVSTSGIFIKTGGTITGYSSDPANGNVVKITGGVIQTNGGHAVYSSDNNTINNYKRRENTAGLSINMDSRKTGTAGGWEN